MKFAAPSAFRPAVRLPGLRHKYSLDIAPNLRDHQRRRWVTSTLVEERTAANLFSTSAAIPQNHLVVLEDPEHNFLAGNIVPL